MGAVRARRGHPPVFAASVLQIHIRAVGDEDFHEPRANTFKRSRVSSFDE